MKRRILFWLLCNVNLGPLAPHVMAWALDSKAKRVEG